MLRIRIEFGIFVAEYEIDISALLILASIKDWIANL